MKKNISILLILSLFLNIFFSNTIFAAGDINIQTFSIVVNSGTATNGNVFINPGDIIKILISGENKYGNINNLKTEFNFSNNTDFTYNNPNLTSSYIWWSPIFQNIQQSVFNPPLLNIAPISNSSVNGDIIDLYYTNFKFESSAKNYITEIKSRFLGDGYTGNFLSRFIYVNVKPHITDYYFEKGDGSQTTSQIQGGNAETINFVAKVKDYNGCSNIDGGVVTANLSQLGLSSSESLSYVSCEADGKTAIFKKTGITTLAALGPYTFSYNLFNATDEDGNTIDPNDSNTTFDNEDKKDDIIITVVSTGSPSITKTTPSNLHIGPNQTTSNFDVSSNMDGQYSIAINSDGNCNGGTTIIPWTGSGYIANDRVGVSINQSNLNEGINKIYICFKNLTDEIGSDYVEITKDSIPPTISNITVSPASVVTNDTTVSFVCSENGGYEVTPEGGFSSSVIANQPNSQVILNSNLSEGSNNITIICKDNANNSTSGNATVTKSTAPPSMSGAILSFGDTDINMDGLDGSDINFTLDNSIASSYAYFESFRLYLLPSSVTFDKNTQTYIKLITDKTISSWQGDNSITKDSTDTDLVSGGSYKVCIAIMATNGQLGEAGCSSNGTLIIDYPEHPAILSAKFTSDTNLEITTDTTLNTTVNNHSGSLVSFIYNGNTITGTTVSSIDSKKINITIPSLSNLGATGSSLIALTGAINAFSGGYNNYFSSGILLIEDGQNPTITSFQNNTVSIYSGFFKGIINLSYTLVETLKGGGSTYIRFARTAGNPASDAVYYITDSTKLSSGNKSLNLDLDSLGLVSGTTYDVQLVGTDIAGNSGNSNIISGLKYDNAGPSIITVLPVGIVGIINPTLSWLATSDNSGFGAGVKNYELKIYTGSTCSGSYSTQTISDPLTLNLQINLANLNNYAWNITPLDNLNNTGTTSNCDSFIINTFVPAFSNNLIKDTVLNNTSYTKSNNTIEIVSKIDNTDINHIWLDASSLKDSSYSNINCASTGISGVSCSYTSNIAKFIFDTGFAGALSSGVKQARFTSSNTAGINTGTTITSITLDNSAPVVGGGIITSPTGSDIFGGASKNIIWNTAGITDNIAIAYIKLEYSDDGGTTWFTIGTGSNTSPYLWNLSSIGEGANYRVRINAYDQVGNSGTPSTTALFSIDKTPPTIGVINLGLNKNIYKPGDVANISWTSANITDANLGATPISLQYSLDNGTNWTNIITNSANDGVENWTIPNYNSNQVKVKLIATDSASNSGNTIGSSTYIIDSILPTTNVTFAGNGGTTPQNGKYINNTGLDLSVSATDNYIDKVYYSLEDNGLFWNDSGNIWLGTPSWNEICSDGILLGTNNNCTNVSQTVNPTGIASSSNYRLIIKSTDEAGNEKAYNPIDYIGDITPPTLNINIASGTYFSGSININGNASDALSGLSSTNIQIKKISNGDWWDGTNWINTGSAITLATSGIPANWNYNFNSLVGDNNGENYLINILSYDSAFKINNSTGSSITVKLDKTGPTINSTNFWINPSTSTGEIVAGGTNYTINWDKNKITDSLSGLSHIKLAYWDGSQYQNINTNIENSGSYTFVLPLLDIDSSIRLTAIDNVGNSNGIVSPTFTIDSTPPDISKIETVGDTNGKIAGVIVYFSEIVNIPVNAYNNFSSSTGTITSMDLPVNTSTGTSVKLNFTSPVGNTATTPIISYTSGVNNITDRANNTLATTNNITSQDKVGPVALIHEIYDNNSNGKLDQIKVIFSENLANNTNITGLSLNNALLGMSITSLSTNSNSMYINLLESTNYNTNPDNIEINLNNSIFTDSDGNLASNFNNENLDDKASPILLGAITNGNEQVDRVGLVFSENLNGSISGFTLNGFSPGAYTGANVLSGNLVSLNTDYSLLNTDQTGSLSYTGNINDGNGNYLQTISNYPINDGVAPKVLTSETQDTNNNGKIDQLIIKTSEKLANLTGSISIGGGSYTVNGVAISGNDILVSVNEKTLEDTSITPSINFSSNTFYDLANNSVNNYSQTPQDKIGPVITGARYSSNIVYISASENINGTLDASSFVLSGSLANYQSVSYSGSQITLNLDGNPGNNAYISFASGSVADNYNNKQSSNKFTIISSSVVINEVMYSTGNTQYIELKNLGSNSVDLTKWKIKNAGGNGEDITITSGNIAGNGLFLIAKNGITTLSGVTEKIETNLNLDPISQNDLILEDSTVGIYDKVITFPWPAGNSASGIAMERMNNPGDGLNPGSWYSSVVNNGLTSGYLGTPGNNNVFDSTNPIISASTPNDNAIYPLGNFTATYDYSDNIAINTDTANLILKNGSNVDITNNGNITSSGVNQNQATYSFSGLTSGKYTLDFSISDTSGNTTYKSIIFYVDNVSMTISTGSVNIGNLEADGSIYFATETQITIKTVGAGFNLKLGGDSIMNGPAGGIGSYSGSYGYGFDYAESGSGDIINYSGILTAINNNILGNYSANPSIDGSLKTYIYSVKYGARINSLQAAGNYNSNSIYTINLSY